MDDLQFYVLFNGVTVISGRREVDNERLFAMDHRLHENLNTWIKELQFVMPMKNWRSMVYFVCSDSNTAIDYLYRCHPDVILPGTKHTSL